MIEDILVITTNDPQVLAIAAHSLGISGRVHISDFTWRFSRKSSQRFFEVYPSSNQTMLEIYRQLNYQMYVVIDGYIYPSRKIKR